MASKEGEKKSLAHNLLSTFLLLYAMLFWKSVANFFWLRQTTKTEEKGDKKTSWLRRLVMEMHQEYK